MVDERIGSECKYDLCRRQFTEDPIDKLQFDLRESGLIEKKDCATGTGLSPTNCRQNVVHFFFKWAIADNNLLAIDSVPAFLQDLSKMIGVGSFLIDEIELAIEIQGFCAIPV